MPPGGLGKTASWSAAFPEPWAPCPAHGRIDSGTKEKGKKDRRPATYSENWRRQAGGFTNGGRRATLAAPRALEARPGNQRAPTDGSDASGPPRDPSRQILRP